MEGRREPEKHFNGPFFSNSDPLLRMKVCAHDGNGISKYLVPTTTYIRLCSMKGTSWLTAELLAMPMYV